MDTELIVAGQLNALDLFTGTAMDPLIAKIKAIVEKHVPDTSTAKGRAEIASLARKVASSKVVLDELGKDLVSDWKEKAKKVDVVRKCMRDELDALRDHARLPLTRWEEAEAERLRQETLAKEIEAAWDEAHAEYALRERERMVREREAEIERQEAARVAKEELARLERERHAREEWIAREAEAKAKREAEEVIAREKARAERAEQERVEAEIRAKAEQEAAVRLAEQAAREEAEKKERDRLAAEKAERDRQEKLAANKRHRLKVEHDAIDSATDEGLPDPEAWIAAIAEGKITNVTIQYC